MTHPSSAGPPRRRAVVTGASRGLGAVVARLLAGEGYDLVLTARDPTPLARLAAALRAYGGTVADVPGDVGDPSHRARVRDEVGPDGGLDLLVNNASELGISPLPPLVQYPLAELERVYRINVIAPIAFVQLLAPALGRRRGLVVNISSDAAIQGYPGWGGYGASKAALDLVSLTFAHELAPAGIHVVSVDPGDVRTALHQSAYPGEDISDRPPPEVTLPFWAWLLGRPPAEINGHRFRAQAEHWGAPA